MSRKRNVFFTAVLSLLCSAATAAPQAGWRLDKNAKWETENGKKILTVSAPEAVSQSFQIQNIDMTPYIGKDILLKVDIRANDVKKPKNTMYHGVKFMLILRQNGRKQYFETRMTGLRYGTYNWTTSQIMLSVPENIAKNAELVVGLQNTSGTAAFRNFSIQEFKHYSPELPENFRCEYTGSAKSLPILRGVMSPQPLKLKKEDVTELGRWKANAMRYQLNVPRSLAGDPAKYRNWMERCLKNLDNLLPEFKKQNIYVILDMHTPPGGRYGKMQLLGTASDGKRVQTTPQSAFRMFFEDTYKDLYLACWKEIAERYKDQDIIVAYDLVNEPDQSMSMPKYDYLWLQEQAANTIRKIDPEKLLIVTCDEWAKARTFPKLRPLPLKNILYTFHFYQPGEYTHQGIADQFKQAKQGKINGYPGKYDGYWFDREQMRISMKPVRDFQLKYGAKIYVGEFSVIRFAKGGAQYLEDAISLFEEYGWNWTYHAFREWDYWSVEHSDDINDTVPTKQDTDRKKVLLRYFQKNKLGSGN